MTCVYFVENLEGASGSLKYLQAKSLTLEDTFRANIIYLNEHIAKIFIALCWMNAIINLNSYRMLCINAYYIYLYVYLLRIFGLLLLISELWVKCCGHAILSCRRMLHFLLHVVLVISPVVRCLINIFLVIFLTANFKNLFCLYKRISTELYINKVIYDLLYNFILHIKRIDSYCAIFD